MGQLLKNHRTLGFEVSRTRNEEGRELVVLRTGPGKQAYAVAPAHLLMPAAEAEARLQISAELAELIARARFLGLGDDTIMALLADELGRSE